MKDLLVWAFVVAIVLSGLSPVGALIVIVGAVLFVWMGK